jgi:hypothetical protein
MFAGFRWVGFHPPQLLVYEQSKLECFALKKQFQLNCWGQNHLSYFIGASVTMALGANTFYPFFSSELTFQQYKLDYLPSNMYFQQCLICVGKDI